MVVDYPPLLYSFPRGGFSDPWRSLIHAVARSLQLYSHSWTLYWKAPLEGAKPMRVPPGTILVCVLSMPSACRWPSIVWSVGSVE